MNLPNCAGAQSPQQTGLRSIFDVFFFGIYFAFNWGIHSRTKNCLDYIVQCMSGQNAYSFFFLFLKRKCRKEIQYNKYFK